MLRRAVMSIVGGGGGGWTPADLSPVEWFDFSDGSTLTLTSGVVSLITSKGSGGRTASRGNPVECPTFSAGGINGRDAASFNGTNNLLSLSSGLPTTTPMWVAEVFTRPSVGIKSIPIGGSSPGVPPYATQWWIDNVRYSALWSSSSGYATHGGASTDTGAFQSIIVKGASTTSMYQHGVLIGTPQMTRAGNSNLSYIGARASDYHRGMIGEIIIGTSSLSDEDREKLEGYLAHKWGMAAQLPSGHPYKSSPP